MFILIGFGFSMRAQPVTVDGSLEQEQRVYIID